MEHSKIDYGIDLGTTNSSICRMEKGMPVIIKTDALMDTMPSCVSITKKKNIRFGVAAYNDMKSEKRRATKDWQIDDSNTFLEFKRSMGTDKVYHSSNMNKDFSSDELSAELLKGLKSFVTDENIKSIVITVPAKFTVNQKTATMSAAKMAGFEQCVLLQEPIAASMAYGLSSEQKNGYWMVYDFGGGTFDAALLKVEDGIMQVFDTEGDNYLGGKNIDEAIVNDIILPYVRKNNCIDNILSNESKSCILREAIKTYAEEVKIQLSFKDKEDIISNLGDLGCDDNGDEIELDMTISQSELFNVIKPVFQKSVDICNALLKRNNLSGSDINKIILVGGPTHSPLIKSMLKEQVSPNVDDSIDPMTAVAVGAALYASTIDCAVKQELQEGTIKLDIGYETTSVETTEFVSIKIDDKNSEGSCPESVVIELERGDKGWSSGKKEIGSLGDVVEVALMESKPNMFSVLAYDKQGNKIKCFPSEITIIQGSKVGSAPLPYNIGIEIFDTVKGRPVFASLKGLEKNKPLPAIGVRNGLTTTVSLIPGNANDILKIPVYQADYDGEGKTASLFEYVADVVVTGNDISQLIPADSDVDVTLKADSSEMMKMDVFFPLTQDTVSKELNTSKKQSVSENYIKDEIAKAQKFLNTLGVKDDVLQKELDAVKNESVTASDRKQVLQHLKEIMRKIEDLNDSTEWDRLEKEIKGMFTDLERANKDLGDAKSSSVVNSLRSQADEIISRKDVSSGRGILEQMRMLFMQLTMVYQLIGFIDECNKKYNSYSWKDAGRARQLINKGISVINANPSEEKLMPIAQELMSLLPEETAMDAGAGLLKGK